MDSNATAHRSATRILSAKFSPNSFAIFRRSMISQGVLPFDELLNHKKFDDVFEKHGVTFGRKNNGSLYAGDSVVGDGFAIVFFGVDAKSSSGGDANCDVVGDA